MPQSHDHRIDSSTHHSLAVEIRDLSFSYFKEGLTPHPFEESKKQTIDSMVSIDSTAPKDSKASLDSTEVPILRNIHIEIKKGELVAIQGPSGSGKSTLLYLLGCLLRPQNGLIKILEHNIATYTNEELAELRNSKIGFVFQQFHLLPRTSVIKNILMPTEYNSSATSRDHYKSRALSLAEQLGLNERLHHAPNQLSGGQQQRVAIARALINDPEIIFADEPTGNLDSKTAQQILDLFRQLNRQHKKTIIIITHDNEVAAQCDRIIHIKDGSIVTKSLDSKNHKSPPTNADSQNTDSKNIDVPSTTSVSPPENYQQNFKPHLRVVRDQTNSLQQNKSFFISRAHFTFLQYLKWFYLYFPLALRNLSRNKTRSVLTMLGITVGVAAVLSMMTLGQFIKDKILAGYAEMGVNTLIFIGNPNWEQKATDLVPIQYRNFNWERDLLPLKKIFPQLELMSPLLNQSGVTVNFGGKSIDSDLRAIGVNEEALIISKRKLLMGRNFNFSDMEFKKPVCIIGYEIGQTLFSNINPIGQIMRMALGEVSIGCHIVGVFDFMTSNKEWSKPNLEVYLPFTYFQAVSTNWWSSQIRRVMLQVNVDTDIEQTGQGIKSFFEQKYGRSGKFRVDSDSVLLAQMKRFLGLFTLLLAAIALVTLSVGGIGITNMMLVSVSERYREIGLRKALGATDRSIRLQFLTESITLCTLAGLFGLFFGFIGYHAAIWMAAQFVSKMKFEWTIDILALLLSLLSILLVGILSGLFPAFKAEKLQVIEALRSE